MTTKDEQIAITKYDLMYEQRMTRVETTLEGLSGTMKDIKYDFRLLITIILGGFGSLFALMAKGFHWF